MKLLDSFVVMSNILAVIILFMLLFILMPLQALSDPDSPHLIVTFFVSAVLAAIGIFLLIALPFLAPSGLLVLGGLWMTGTAAAGTLVNGIGAILILIGLASLCLFGTYMCDSYKARYWRMQWSNRSLLERLIGPAAPYNEISSNFSGGSGKFESKGAEKAGGMSFDAYREYQEKRFAEGKPVPTGFRKE